MKKITIRIMLIMILLSLIIPVTVKAGYQANKDTKSQTSVTADGFFEAIRLMESPVGTLGVNSNIDNTTFVDASKNGIDCHMAKNTEWGTAAMLAASSYGTAPSGRSDLSTTGNKTGVFQMADGTYEYVAGIWKENTSSYIPKINKADTRYLNLYTDKTSIPGDATLETQSWYDASYANFVTASNPVFRRSFVALFGFDYGDGNNNSSGGSRAVVVCGAGL